MKIVVGMSAHNESKSLPILFSRIDKFFKSKSIDYTIVFLDNGSTDDTMKIVKDASSNYKIIYYKNEKMYSFQKAITILAGYCYCITADRYILLDADLQFDPFEFYKLLDLDYDLVCGIRKRRSDPIIKIISSMGFHTLFNTIFHTKLKDPDCGFRSYTRDLILIQSKVRYLYAPYTESKYIAVLFGYKIKDVYVNHYKRKFGVSKVSPKSIKNIVFTILISIKGILKLREYVKCLI